MRLDPTSNYIVIRDQHERAIADAALVRSARQPDRDRPRPPRGPLAAIRRALRLPGSTPILDPAAARQ